MIPFWLGLVVSAILAPGIFKLLLRLNSRQTVSAFAPETHQAKQGTPTMGGLIFVIPFLVLALVVGSLGIRTVPLTFLVFAFAVIGFVDDFVVPRLLKGKRGLGWKQKLIMQLVIALVYGFWIKDKGIGLAVDVLVILAASNAYNFADGLDGLAASIALLLIPGIVFLCDMSRNAVPSVGVSNALPLLTLVAGAMIPFAFLNAPKAKVFMGDVGSLPLGALFGAALAGPLAQGTWAPRPAMFIFLNQFGYSDWRMPAGIAVLSLVLLAELLPVPMQIFWVKVFKRKLFPFTPIHHAFEKAGWPETRVVATFALAQALCTLGAITIFTTGTP